MDTIPFLETYGYLLYYISIVMEGQPFYWAAGFLVSIGVFKIWPLLLSPFFITLGDYLFYLVGYKLGSKAVDKYGKYIFLTPKRVELIAKHFNNHKGKMVFLASFVYGTGHNTLLVMGILKGKFKDVWYWSFSGAIVSFFLYAGLGYYLGEGYGYVKEILKDAGIVLAIIIVVVILFGESIYGKRKEKKQVDIINK